MMQVAFQNNPSDFLSKCGSYLAENEAEHNLILSLCQNAEQKLKKGERVDIRCSALFDDDNLVLAAVQTPPHNLVLSKASQPDIEKPTTPAVDSCSASRRESFTESNMDDGPLNQP